ncbi:ferrichrome ABC transporter substrate-binding protein [Paenibacillus marchantiophytorum]|uniref:Ferrichrome ABC transporter substrate-binding protein n=1 Tax=Paenibacillus marchantiophytorum TaxID=1619310 RepID=A0ABQ2BPG0_9BACL|nr:ABC transporter substrate-binding protein [Paenibacillus marchantiophytorum]GGI44513.1 ferrichrome ABC transporter substrate-binding protein [Paenibacillus marchantiophytorum]
MKWGQRVEKQWLLGMIAVFVVVLTACGNGSGGSQGKEHKADGLASVAAAQPAFTAGKFKHVMGEIEIKEQPKRIIGLYMEDFLVALGIKPVAQTVIGSFSLQYLKPHIGDLPKVDTSAINFEAVLQTQPDLLLLAFKNYAEEGRYDQFSKIAPAYVFGEDAPNNWRETLRTVGDLVGKKKEADKVLKDYEAKVAAAKSKLAASIGREKVALLRVRNNKEIRLYGGPQGYSGSVLYKDLGLEVPDFVKKTSWGATGGVSPISMEVLPELDADHLFITIDEAGRGKAKELMESSIWKSLPAVKKGQVHEVDLDHWMTFGPVAYNMKVDDVVKALVK